MIMVTAGGTKSHIGSIPNGATIIVALGMLAMGVTKSGVIGITDAVGNMKLGGVINHAKSLCSK